MKRTYSLLKIIFSLALLAVILARTGWQAVAAAVGSAQPAWLGLALGIYLLGVFVRAVRWRILLGGLGTSRTGIGRLAGLYFVSFFFNSFLPTGIGGDVVRIAELVPAVGAPVAASSVIADRTVGLVATSLLALVALPLAGSGLNWLLVLIAGVIAIGIPAIFGLLAQREAGGLVALGRAVPFVRPLTEHRQVRRIVEALTAYTARDLGLALAVSLLFAFLNALTYACIGVAVRVDLPLAYYVLISPIITLVMLVPISFNGWGTRDVAYQALFVPAGVTPGGALAMSLSYHALNLVTAVIGGLVYAAWGTSETLAKA